MLRIFGNVVGPGAQQGDAALGATVGGQQLKEQFVRVKLAATKLSHALLNGLSVQRRHGLSFNWWCA